MQLFIQLWETVRKQGLRTIKRINELALWDYSVTPKEHTIKDTFYHTIKAIFEDAGNWFLNDSSPYEVGSNPIHDLNSSIDRMIHAMRILRKEDLDKEFKFPWGERTTITGAIHQTLFHAIGHFAQIRNWTGIFERNNN